MAWNNGVNRVILLGNIDQDGSFANPNDRRDSLRLVLVTNEVMRKNNAEAVHLERHLIKISPGCLSHKAMEFSQGRKLTVEGRIATRSYIDYDGEKRYVSEIEVNAYRFVD